MDVTLTDDTKELSEVVATGYATNQKGAMKMSPDRPKRSAPAPATTPLEVMETYQPTTLSYDIDEPYTVLTDGKVYVADIKTNSVPATYDYLAVPKLEKDAFLTAHVVNWKDLNLLEAEARLFFEGAYLGKTLLDVRNAGDTLDLSLGRDKGIVVERKRLPDFSAGRFLSNNKVVNRGFEITVRNNKPQPITITVLDQFPVSTEKDITVDLDDASNAQVNKETGVLTWKDDLPARQSRKHTLKYNVKYPKDQVVVLE